MVTRQEYQRRLQIALSGRTSPVVALLGPRQCGKTTLAQTIAADRESTLLDLEDARHRDRLANPMLTLERLNGLVVLDEIQRMPPLFETLRVLADRRDADTQFLILGSASPQLVKGVSESLAGRVAFVDLAGFNLGEVGIGATEQLWTRGGFPRSFLAGKEPASLAWRNDFIRTFLERDVPQLGITMPADALRRFWTMLAHYHGQVWNAAEFARSLGATEAAARRYLDILCGAYMVRGLQPWHENIKKRQVKSPKVYIRDTGILHALLGIGDFGNLVGHPKIGASWEGFVIEELLATNNTRDAYFWATHQGAEIDLLMISGGRRIGFEIKYTDSPRITKSLRIATQDLQLDRAYVVYPGDATYPLDRGITAITVADALRSSSD